MRRNTLRGLVGVAALVTATLAGITSARPADAYIAECVGDCGTAVVTHTETPSNPRYGDAVEFFASVHDDTWECLELFFCATATGSIEWYDGDSPTPFLSAPLHEVSWVTEGLSSTPDEGVSFSGLSGGSHTITVKYVPAEPRDFEPASTQFTLGVQPRETLTYPSLPSNAVVGERVTLTAVVGRGDLSAIDPAAVPPSGAVEFIVDGIPLGTAPIVDRTAEFETTFVTRGTHSILMRYLGDDNYDWSLSPMLSFNVGKGGTAILIDQPVSPTVYGEPATFMASVAVQAPASGTPSGTVTLTDVVTGPLANAGLTNGSAALNIPSLSVGSHRIVGNYLGDDSFNRSASDVITHTVIKAATRTTLNAAPNPSSVGQEVMLSASVSVVAPGAGTPTGSVQFLDGNMPLGSPLALTGNAATLKVKALGGGTHNLTAHYLGDDNFNPSSGAQSHTVRCDRVVGNVSGTYYVPATGSTCITNANITGHVMVPAGATLSIVNSTIGGVLQAGGGSGAIAVCGSSIGDVTITSSNGAVTVGSPYVDGCASNTLRANVRLQTNRAGVRFDGNRVAGTVQVTGTSGGPSVIGGNNVGGYLQCSGNSPAATNGGKPNAAGGRTGECAAAGF